MKKREYLIALALKYNGEYFNMLKAIKQNEKVEELNLSNCLTIFDSDYPKSLLSLQYPPLVLFYKGNIKLIKDLNIIGVVGSRFPCEYASRATKDLVNHYHDLIVVSGLAKGIDALAHSESKRSIGVLGCGIDYIYPYENKELYLKLEKEGLIISEYPGLYKPYAYHFPFRNRIIAALCKELYVMQSSEKSGTVTTINEALKLQKDVKILPFSLYEKEGLYNNYLINEGALLINKEDIKIDIYK